MPFFSLPSGSSPILAGPTAPTGGVGQVGDLFLVRGPTGAGLLYGPKDAVSGWQEPIDFSVAPTGPTGPQVTGPTGSTGAASTVTGPTAPASTLTVGSVSTGSAVVHITGTAPSQTIHFTLPFVTGPTGAASTVTGPVGNTGATGAGATGPTGSTGSQEYYATGSAPTPILDGALWLDTDIGKYFVNYDGQFIEIGVQGERGPTGPSGGPTGEVGATGPSGAAGGFDDAQAINAQATGYTLSLADAGKLVTMNLSTGTMNLVIPSAASVAFPTGTHIDVARLGDAAVTVTGATGVTVNATPGQKLRSKFSSGTCILYAADTWLVVGDLSS